jgi:hypothetical protein
VCCVAGVEPLKPIVDTRPAAHIAPIVIARIRLGVSQPKWWAWSQERNPVAAEAAAIAQPTHMGRMISPSGLGYAGAGLQAPAQLLAAAG